MGRRFQNSKRCFAAFVGVLVLGTPMLPAAAQERRAVDLDNLEVTMRLLPEGATRPDPVTRVIELPEALRAEIVGDAARRAEAGDAAAGRGALDEGPRRPDDARAESARELARSASGQIDIVRGQGAAFMPAQDAAALGHDVLPVDRDAVAAARQEAAAASRDVTVDARTAGREAGVEAAVQARDAGRDVAEGARETGRDVAETARETSRDVAESARETGRDVAETARETSRDVAESARETGRDAAESARQAGRDAAGSAREAGRDAADQAREASHVAAEAAREAAREARDLDL